MKSCAWLMMCRRCLRKYVVILVTSVILTVTYEAFILVKEHCSMDTAVRQMHDLCQLYSNGSVIGNLCSELCQKEKFSISQCGGNSHDKHVAILEYDFHYVVLKHKLDMHAWTRNNGLVFNTNESTRIMINRTQLFLIKKFKMLFKTDLARNRDILTFILGHNFTEFIESQTCVASSEEECKRNHTLSALQSILALSSQSEYITMRLMDTAPYMPRLQGTCGPAYVVPFTPSLAYLGYVLFQGKLPEIVRWHKVIPWRERVRVALELIDVLMDLETREPPVFMCDIREHNFGLDSAGHVTILDVDCIGHGQILPDDTACHSDQDCGFVTCRGACDVTTSTCRRYPVNTHLQVACQNIFLSYIPSFGLLRGPPPTIADRLQQLLTECSSQAPTSGSHAPTSGSSAPTSSSLTQHAWKSNETLRQKLVALLKLSELLH